jgi:hypothetical protein
MAGSDLREARAAAASAVALGGAAKQAAVASMGSRTEAAAAPAGRALTCRVQGWEEGVEGMLDLVEVAGEVDGGGRSGGRRRELSPRRHVALGWWASHFLLDFLS